MRPLLCVELYITHDHQSYYRKSHDRFGTPLALYPVKVGVPGKEVEYLLIT